MHEAAGCGSSFAVTKSIRLAHHQIGIAETLKELCLQEEEPEQNQIFSNSNHPEEQPIDNPDALIDIMVVAIAL